MFGLTFEKLFFVTIIAALVLGPSRLPAYAHQLARAVRTVRHFVDTTRSAAEREMGMPLQRSEWESLDLRQYDPRRIVRDALLDSAPTTVVTTEMIEQAARIRPGQKYLVTGASSHPVRTLLASLPADDPRRIAATAAPAATAESDPDSTDAAQRTTLSPSR